MTLLKYIKETNFSGCTESLIYQLILALFIAQQEKQFTHYDLHLENVLLRRCLKRTFFLYKFIYEGVVFNKLIHTNGYFPVIFDYGFAYSKGVENTSYNNSLFFTNKGYTSFMFDEVTDFKTLLVRLAHIRTCPLKFKNLTDLLFLKSDPITFKIDKETGWIKSTISSVGRIICKRLEKSIIDVDHNYRDNFIYKELDNIVELFGILIKLPIGQNNFQIKTLNDEVKKFLLEWNKIDIWFNATSSDDKLNVIKNIFEVLNDLITEENFNESTVYETRSKSEFNRKFKLKLFEILDGYGDFINVENLDYGIFISSIIQISNFIEHMCYAEIQRHKKLFNLSRLMDSWSLFNSIEELVRPESPYTFQLDDNIVIFDCMEKSTSSFELKDLDVIEALNCASNLKVQINLLDNLELKNYGESSEELE